MAASVWRIDGSLKVCSEYETPARNEFAWSAVDVNSPANVHALVSPPPNDARTLQSPYRPTGAPSTMYATLRGI